MINIKKISDSELKEIYKQTYDCIFNTQCYSVSDLVLLFSIENEFFKRDIKFKIKKHIEFN